MSSLKDSDEHTSAPWAPGSLGVHVASSHFSNTNANRGKSGWLKWIRKKYSSLVCIKEGNNIFVLFAM